MSATWQEWKLCFQAIWVNSSWLYVTIAIILPVYIMLSITRKCIIMSISPYLVRIERVNISPRCALGTTHRGIFFDLGYLIIMNFLYHFHSIFLKCQTRRKKLSRRQLGGNGRFERENVKDVTNNLPLLKKGILKCVFTLGQVRIQVMQKTLK